MPTFSIYTEKRLCFWGAPAKVPKATRSIRDCLRETGENSGNLFIGSGLFQNTRAACKEYIDIYEVAPEEIDEKFDAVFVPASNFVFPFVDLADQYEFFRRTNVQIFVFGLGSQVRERGPVPLQAGTQNFIRLAADRSASLGVRGEITAEILRSLGIDNVEVVGCPSLLSLPDNLRNANSSITELSVAASFTSYGREHAFSEAAMASLERHLFKTLVELNGSYILQNEPLELDLIPALLSSDALSGEREWAVNRIARNFDLDAAVEVFVPFLRWNTRMFFSVREWVAFMKGIDFTFGTRFHGNVAGILAGCPALLFCHDFRTLELARFFRLPHRIVTDSQTLPCVNEMIAEADMSRFEGHYSTLLSTWNSFVEKNGFQGSVAY